jgi:hypothetical protein
MEIAITALARREDYARLLAAHPTAHASRFALQLQKVNTDPCGSQDSDRCRAVAIVTQLS